MDNLQKLPATKSNLIKLKEEVKTYIVGHDILEQKRELLLNDLLNYQYEYSEVNKEVLKLFNNLNSVFLDILKIHYLKPKKDNIFDIQVEKKKLHGTLQFEIDFTMLEDIKFYDSLEGIGPIYDEIIEKFQLLMDHIKKWLELYSSLYNILREIEKTSKRVRALENIFIPQYKEKIKNIDDSLSEMDREDFVRRKKIKEKKNDFT